MWVGHDGAVALLGAKHSSAATRKPQATKAIIPGRANGALLRAVFKKCARRTLIDAEASAYTTTPNAGTRVAHMLRTLFAVHRT